MDGEILNEENQFEKEYSENIQSWRATMKAKDEYTLGHLDRVSDLAVLIGEKIGLSQQELQTLKIGALFHDIGKLEIADSILTKETKLSDDEFMKIKQHPAIGVKIIENKTVFKDVIPIVKYHHERYDGRGYPENLAGENIPLLARITTVADAFDAMNSKRTYRNNLDIETIKEEFRKNRGTQFDPKIDDIFLDILENEFDKIKEIQEKYQG